MTQYTKLSKDPGSNSAEANEPVESMGDPGVDKAYVAGNAKGYRDDYSDRAKGNSKGGVNGK